MQTGTGAELREFLDSTRNHYLHPAWLFCASTGVRRSELLGLRWTEVDMTAATARVRQTVVATADGYQLQDNQKSALSARTIHLDRRTVDMPRHRDDQKRAQRAASTAWQESPVPSPGPHVVESASHLHGVPPRRPGRGSPENSPARRQAHAHTHATLLLAAGVNPKVVSERLGHSSVAFTLDTYAHVMPGTQPEAAERFMQKVYGTVDLDPDDGDTEPDDGTEDDAQEHRMGSVWDQAPGHEEGPRGANPR